MPIGDEQWINEQLAQLAAQRPTAMPTGTPDDGTRPSWTGLLGGVLGGGQAPGFKLRGGEADTSGNRALLNFGIQTLLASGPAPVRPDLLSALATGLQGAQSSTDLDQRRAQASAVAQQGFADKQQEMRLAALKEALPLLKLQQEARALAGLKGNTSTATAGDGGFTGDKAKDLALIAQRESHGDPTALNYVAKEDPTAYERGATASGKYQIVNSTWAEGMRLAGLDPSKYVTARSAPESVQDQVASALYDKYGSKPWVKGARDWVKDENGKYQLATVRPAAPGAPAAPPATPGAPAAPPAVQVGGPAPPPPGPPGPSGPAARGAGGLAQALPPSGSPTTVLRETQEIGPDGKPRTVVRPVPATPPTIGSTPPSQQVSANVGAILGGMERASTATPASAMPMMGGPGAGPSAAPARPAEPGWGAGNRATGYGGGSPPPGVVAPAIPGPVPPTGPAAAPVPPTGPGATTPPPAMAAPPPFAMRPLTPTEAAATSYDLPPDMAAEIARDKQNAPDVASFRAAEDKERAAKLARRQAADAARLKIEGDERTAHNAQWQEQQKQQTAQAAATEAARVKLESDLKLKEAEGTQTRLSSAAAADVARQEKRMEAIDTAGGASKLASGDLDMLRSLSKTVGTVNPWTQLVVGGNRVQEWVTKLGVGTPEFVAQMGNQQAYEAALQKIIVGLRQGVSMGNLSDRDMDFFKNQVPDLMKQPETRENIINFLDQAHQRRADYARLVNKYYRPGTVSVADAEDRADAELGPLLKQPPSYKNLPEAARAPAQRLWLYKNIQPGSFFKDGRGKLMPYNPPPGWVPEGAEE